MRGCVSVWRWPRQEGPTLIGPQIGAQRVHTGIIFLSYEKSNERMKKEMGTLHPLGRRKRTSIKSYKENK